jgi:cardiolipin-specific phospholipase
MIHGFGGTGSMFYKLIAHLKDSYRVTTIDLLGMGASGKPTFNLETSQECIDYFVESIEAWMKISGYRNEEYTLLGHSFGGYMATHYAIKYP